MRGRKNLQKHYVRHGFDQILKDDLGVQDLIIEKPEEAKREEKQETKPKQKVKKRTATDVHLEIKKLVEEKKYSLARSVLQKAFKDGFKGKRLDSWRQKLMGSSTKNLWIRPHSKESSLENKEQELKVSKEELKEKTKEKEEMVDIPDLPDFDDETVEIEDKSLVDESGGAVVFGIVGAGQAGGRLAESFYNLGYKKVLAVNTAEHDLSTLADLPEPQKFVMTGEDGGGAGKDMRKGEAAADKHQQEIYESMQQLFGKVDRILVCAGGGGGTGAGACLRLVETAKKYLQYIGVTDVNSKVGVLLTLPTAGECSSPTIANNAHLIASTLCEYAESGKLSPLIIFDNDKIKKMYGKKLTVRQFWPTVNATVTGLFHMFNVLSAQASDFTSFDPADYSRVLSAGGCMIMGMTTLKAYQNGTDVSEAIRSNLEKGLLCGGFDVATAKAASCIATAPSHVIDSTAGLMESFESGFDTLANITGNATVFRGIYEVSKDKVVVYTMLTGLGRPQKRLTELKKFQDNKVKKSKLYEDQGEKNG